jgi:hypothetical protein
MIDVLPLLYPQCVMKSLKERNSSSRNCEEKLLTKLNKKKFLVPCFLGLFLGLFGALIQKHTLDRPH